MQQLSGLCQFGIGTKRTYESQRWHPEWLINIQFMTGEHQQTQKPCLQIIQIQISSTNFCLRRNWHYLRVHITSITHSIDPCIIKAYRNIMSIQRNMLVSNWCQYFRTKPNLQKGKITSSHQSDAQIWLGK